MTSAPRPSVSSLMRDAKVFAAGIDHVIGAVRLDDLQALPAPCSADHGRAERFAAFHRGETDTARTPWTTKVSPARSLVAHWSEPNAVP